MHSVHCTLCMGLASGLGRAASLGVREVNNKSSPDAEWGGLHLASKIKRTEHKLKLFSQIIVKLISVIFFCWFLGWVVLFISLDLQKAKSKEMER